MTSKSTCRLRHIPYDCTFGILICAPYPLQKSLTNKEKNWHTRTSNLHPTTGEPDAQLAQHTEHSSNQARNVHSIYYQLCLGCGFAGMYVGEVSARNVYKLAFKAP